MRTLRHVRIRYRLLASFLLLSLVPALCVGLYASGVYARAMSGKLRQSAEQSAYLLNENFITELNKFRGYLNTISVTDAVQNALSAQQEAAFTLDAESVNEIADALRMIPFQSTYLKISAWSTAITTFCMISATTIFRVSASPRCCA